MIIVEQANSCHNLNFQNVERLALLQICAKCSELKTTTWMVWTLKRVIRIWNWVGVYLQVLATEVVNGDKYIRQQVSFTKFWVKFRDGTRYVQFYFSLDRYLQMCGSALAQHSNGTIRLAAFAMLWIVQLSPATLSLVGVERESEEALL